jgi:hypothetical protein
MKKWTYNGIKRYYPGLTFEGWLWICVKKQHRNKNPSDVVIGIITSEEG